MKNEKITKSGKSNPRAHSKSRKSRSEASRLHKDFVRKPHSIPLNIQVGKRMKSILSQIKDSITVEGITRKYTEMAINLSALAGLEEGRVWSWNYVMSVHSGALVPGKKFIHAVELYFEKVDPRRKQWFYFAYRRYFVSVFAKSAMKEVLYRHMRELHFKPVTSARYLEIKKMATGKKKIKR